MKKLHDILVAKVTEDKFLTKIVGKAGLEWTTEYPVDKGYIDVFVRTQKPILEYPVVIEIETGYNLNGAEIIQKFRRYQKSLTKHPSGIYFGGNKSITLPGVFPSLNLVVPKGFEELHKLFKNVGISVFVWDGQGDWKCPVCEKITSAEAPWKPPKCIHCDKQNRSFTWVGLNNFKLTKACEQKQ